jgi:hypothetical protein
MIENPTRLEPYLIQTQQTNIENLFSYPSFDLCLSGMVGFPKSTCTARNNYKTLSYGLNSKVKLKKLYDTDLDDTVLEVSHPLPLPLPLPDGGGGLF